MKLIAAINAVARGNSIVSNANKRYTHEQLAPSILGPTAVSFNDVGMTEAERKGVWRIEDSHK